MNRTKQKVKTFMMKSLRARRLFFPKAGKRYIIGQFWLVPLKDPIVLATHRKLGNPHPVTIYGIVVPTQDAKEFIQTHKSIKL